MNSDNPYASPTVPTKMPEIISDRVPSPASRGKRFINLIVDNIVIQVLSTVAGVVLGVIYGAFLVASGGTISQDDEAILNLVGFAVGVLVAVSYFVVMEALFQRTIAKFLTGTRVVTPDGGRPSFGQIVGRSFARLIPFEAFSFLGSAKPIGWHDSLSGTRVVEV